VALYLQRGKLGEDGDAGLAAAREAPHVAAMREAVDLAAASGVVASGIECGGVADRLGSREGMRRRRKWGCGDVGRGRESWGR
jgi:hypothetical protein